MQESHRTRWSFSRLRDFNLRIALSSFLVKIPDENRVLEEEENLNIVSFNK